MTLFNKTQHYQEDFLLLDKHFQQIFQYLREQKSKKLPLHIVIGRQDCGKTTLIRQAELSFLQVIPAIQTYKKDSIADQRKTFLFDASEKNGNNDDYCRWWINKDGILLDIPGSFTDPIDDAKQQNFWRRLVKLLQRTKKYLQLQSVIYVISVPDLLCLDKAEQLPWLQQHKRLLFDLAKHLKTKLTLYFLVTKCDLLHGFNEYFDDLRADERIQCLGCTFENKRSNNTTIKSERPLTDIFNLNFDYLLDQLNAHVISRIHQERQLGKRAIIKEFPLQFETLQHLLTNLIAELGEKTFYCDAAHPSGIYFTSAIQRAGDYIIDRLKPSLMTSFEFADKPYQTVLTHNSRAYFINCFFADLLNHCNKIAKKVSWGLSHRWFKNISQTQLAISSTIIFALVFLSGATVWQYQQDKQLLTKSQVALKNYQLKFSHLKPQVTSINQTLAALNSIYQANKFITQVNQSWLTQINFLADGNLAKSANRAYRTTLQTLLLPQLKQSLENKLLASNTDPKDLFQALKAYLILGKPERHDLNYIITWAIKNWQATLSKQENKNLQFYLQDLLTPNNYKIILNSLAVTQARQILNAYPKSYLAYLSIIENAKNQGLPPFATSMVVNKNIPYLYTVAGYKYIFLKELIELTNKQSNDAWVFQDNAGTNPLVADKQYNKLILDLYFKDYVSWWQNYLRTAFNAQFNSIDQVVSLLKNLTSNSVDLKNNLRAIAGNINAQLFVQAAQTRNSTLSSLIQSEVKENFTETLTPTQKALTNLTNTDTQFQQTFNALRKFQDYLKALTTAKNKPETAFQLAVLHANADGINDPLNNLFSIGKQQSQPLQDWLISMGTKSWQIILNLTKDFLNEKWQREIWPFYNSNINNLYPIVDNANKDISLANFSQFFGNDGVLTQFFDHYLKPFIETENVQWQWKTINGLSLPITNNVPQLFERARIIRQMFFPNNINVPQFHFVLKPTKIEPVIANIVFTIAGQSMLSTPTKHTTYEFFWPNNNKDSASVTITNANQQKITDIKEGPFALFRLLNDAQLQTGKNPKLYTLMFYLNGMLAAEYQLTVDDEINPFIPHIIDQFKCPPSL